LSCCWDENEQTIDHIVKLLEEDRRELETEVERLKMLNLTCQQQYDHYHEWAKGEQSRLQAQYKQDAARLRAEVERQRRKRKRLITYAAYRAAEDRGYVDAVKGGWKLACKWRREMKRLRAENAALVTKLQLVGCIATGEERGDDLRDTLRRISLVVCAALAERRAP
jgi:hypothetical protein